MTSVLLLSILLGADPAPERIECSVNGVRREALVYVPNKASESLAPLVFAFHGHGGTARHAAQNFKFQQHWPEAVVVYIQGVPTPGRLTDPEGKRTGWQHDAGDHEDRDLKFFDALLTTIKAKHKIDEDRIYATGHSNGGAFTYLLWAQRPDVFAALAPSAAGSRSIRSLKPKPAMHIAGEKDEIVRFAGQQRVMQAVRTINGCVEPPKEWAKGCLLYPSKKDAPFVSFIHPGDHKYSDQASALIVKFFKEHARKSPAVRSK
jgi:polyhydroxybutyrate depolymerase